MMFLMLLTAGMLGVLATCRMDEVAWKFVRLIAIFCVALPALVMSIYVARIGVGAAGWADIAAGLSLLCSIAAFVVTGLAPVADRIGRVVRMLAAGGACVGFASACAWGVHAGVLPSNASAMIPALLALAISALLVGSVTLATALGHAYLTQTAMTIQPMRRLARIFAIAIAARVAWAMAGTALGYAVNAHVTMSALTGQLFMLSVRVAVGLLIPSVFAYMVVETVRLRSTQSATGILYFTLVLVYIGELSSLFLMKETGLSF